MKRNPLEWTILLYTKADGPGQPPVGEARLRALQSLRLDPRIHVFAEVILPDRMTRLHAGYGPGRTDARPTDAVEDLKSFIDWGLGESQGTRGALVLSAHGTGWELYKRPHPPQGDGVSGPISFSAPDLARALGDAKRLDVVGIDACQMAVLEVAYEIREKADFMVASETLEPAVGWPYVTILSELQKHPTMSPDDLSRLLVRCYREQEEKFVEGATISAFNLRGVEDLAKRLDAVGAKLRELLADLWPLMDCVREKAFSPGPPELRDLMAILRGFEVLAERECREAMRKLESTVYPWQQNEPDTNGTLIVFPQGCAGELPSTVEATDQLLKQYESLAFDQHHEWGKFLREFVRGGPKRAC